MRSEADRWLGALFHGWVGLLTLMGMLAAALALLGWAWNRGLRPADRGALVRAPLFLGGAAMVLLLRAFRDDWLAAGIVAAGLMLAGLLGRMAEPRGLWLPAMAFAALLGLERNLSALVLLAVAFLALLFSSNRPR